MRFDTNLQTKRPCSKYCRNLVTKSDSRTVPSCAPSSSMSYLPVELLSRIFLLGYGDYRNARRPNQNFEILVSHVNSRWRHVAIRETRRLWTHIHLSDVSHIRRAATYLERSGGMLIDIVIDTVSSTNHVPGRTLFREEFRPVFSLLTPHVMRWRSFVLKVRDCQCIANASDALSKCGPAPALTFLQLSHVESSRAGAENFWISTVFPPVTFFDGQLPSLTELSLIGVNISWAPSRSPFLKELKSLELALHCEYARPTYDQWESILRSCPTLEKLSLHYSGPRVSSGWSDRPISLPELNELSIADLDPDHLCSVFQRLTIEKVTQLRLELPDQNYTPFIDLIQQAHSRVLSQIEFLHIDSLDCTRESWQQLLVSAHSVKTLEVDFRRIPSGFCEALLYVDRGDKARNHDSMGAMSDLVLPKLTILRVSGVSGSFLGRFDQFRKEWERPIEKYLINESCRDKDAEMLCRVVWFEDEEDETASSDGGDAEDYYP